MLEDTLGRAGAANVVKPHPYLFTTHRKEVMPNLMPTTLAVTSRFSRSI